MKEEKERNRSASRSGNGVERERERDEAKVVERSEEEDKPFELGLRSESRE